MSAHIDEPTIGSELGRFKLLALLGQGASGAVFKAHDNLMDRQVALKVLNKNQLDNPTARARFEREGIIVSSLSHENIVQFYAVGVSESGYPFIAMELLEGKTLREVLSADKSLDLKRALNIAIEVASALEYAFSKGVVHRDLKPENIILIETGFGEVAKVLDFGLAKNTTKYGATSATLTEAGQMIGSCGYMAPELVKGQSPDNRSDVYAVTCILFECITGSQPYQADSPHAVLLKHATDPIPPINKFLKTKPNKDLDGLIHKGMAKDAQTRFQTAGEMKAALLELRDKSDKTNIQKTELSQKQFLTPLLASFCLLLAAAGCWQLQKKLEAEKVSSERDMPLTSLQLRQLLIAAIVAENSKDVSMKTIDKALSIPDLSATDRGLLFRLKAKYSKHLALKTFFQIRAINEMASNEASSPMPAELDSLRFAAQGCEVLGLLDRQHRFINSYINKLTKWIKDGKPIPTKYRVQDKVPDELNLRNAKLERVLVLISSKKTNEALAEYLKLNKESKYVPEATLTRIRWKLGDKKLVEDSIYGDNSTPEYLTFLSNFFRDKGLNDLARKSVEQGFNRTQFNITEELFQADVSLEINRNKISEAIKILKKRFDFDSNLYRSNWRNYASRRSLRIAALAYCGDLETAYEKINLYLKNGVNEAEDQVNLVAMNAMIKECPKSSAKEQINYFVNHTAKLKDSAQIWFATGVAKSIAKSANLSQTEQTALWYEELLAIRPFILPNRELDLCKKILSVTEAQSKNTPLDLQAHNFAAVRIAELYHIMENDADCVKQLEKLEADDDITVANEAVFSLEIQLNRIDKAKQIVARCPVFSELLAMSAASNRNGHQELSEICLQKAQSLIGKDRAKQQLFYAESALVSLELRETQIAEEIMRKVDPHTIKILAESKRLNAANIGKIALALALSNKPLQADEIARYAKENLDN